MDPDYGQSVALPQLSETEICHPKSDAAVKLNPFRNNVIELKCRTNKTETARREESRCDCIQRWPSLKF